jgi:predicted double-glycine peptidase
MKRLALIVALSLAPLAQAATVEVRGPRDGGFAARVVSVKEARFTTTVRQQFDFSCGSAAVATLLTHHYGVPVTEREVFAQMFERGDQAKIRKHGFSMLDMKRYLESRGFQADGFDQPIERLEQENLPAIVLLSERGYRHFVVVKGIARGRVLVGDPAMGTRSISFDRFSHLWVNHLLFVVHNRREMAQFNLAADWHVAPAAPLFQAIDRQRLLDSLPVRRAGAF